MSIEETKDILGAAEQDRDFVMTVADNLGWSVLELDGVGKPDFLLMRNRTIAVFVRAKRMYPARMVAMGALLRGGTLAVRWGREDGTEIMETLA